MRNTILSTFYDTDRLRFILKRNPDTRIYTKEDHTIVYMENEYERFISAERWKMKQDALIDFMNHNGDEHSYTSPSSFAMSLYKKKFASGNFTMQANDFRSNFCRDALYGGRCEVYKYGKHYLYQYDINSSYPHSATALLLPDAHTMEYCKNPSIDNIYRYEGVSDVTFSQSGNIPVLPLRYMRRVVYGICEKQKARYTHTELRYAIECGIIVHSVNKQYIARETVLENPFNTFVDYCYTKRLEYGHKIWKIICNALFGRLATMNKGLLMFRVAKKSDDIFSVPNRLKDYFGAVCIAKELNSPPDANVLWASMILSHARIKLHQKIAMVDTYYVDTDCFMTPDKQELRLSHQLGDFKLKEGDYEIRGAKQYKYSFGDSSEVKLKGIAKKFMKDADFYAARYTQERLIHEDGTTSPIIIGA